MSGRCARRRRAVRLAMRCATLTATCSAISSRTRRAAARSAAAGAPGAGYRISNSARGKPPKSWMVSGRGARLTAGAPMVSQCAETTTIALGRGSAAPRPCRKRRAGVSWMASMGEPWERNSVGKGVMSGPVDGGATAPTAPIIFLRALSIKCPKWVTLFHQMEQYAQSQSGSAKASTRKSTS